MVIERKIIVGLEDLRAVIFECRNEAQRCTSRVSISPDRGLIPEKCPDCGVEWVRHPLQTIEVKGNVFTQFVRLLAEVRSKQPKANEEYPRFRIMLEFDEPTLDSRHEI